MAGKKYSGRLEGENMNGLGAKCMHEAQATGYKL